MVDPLSGHTRAKNTLGADGLRDGDALSSATLTNVLQGVRGNGIIRMQDGLYGAPRNAVDGQPGAVARVSASPSFQLTITGGYAVLDGQLYEFGGGPGGSATVTLGNASHGSGTALAASNEQSLYVVYVASKGGSGRVYADGGTSVDVSTGVYPSIPSAYLEDYDGASGATNEQVIVLATVRCSYNSGGSPNNHKVDVIEINDKRHFLRANPIYMFPLTSGTLIQDSSSTYSQVQRAGNKGIQTAAELRTLHAGDENGDIGTTANTSSTLIDAGVLWMSTSKSGTTFGFGPGGGEDRAGQTMKDELFFAAQENSETSLVSKRLFTKGVSAPSAARDTETHTLTSHGDQFIVLNINDGEDVRLNPEKDGSNYLFPEGHTIEVYVTNTGDGTVIFDGDGLNSAVVGASPSGTRRKFLYDGSAWLALPYSTGGVTTWLGLDDTESSYTALKTIRVNAAGNALEFYDAATALPGIHDVSSLYDDQITISDTAVTINADHDDLDFKVISDDQSVILHVDGASGGKVGIMQSTPLMTLQVEGVGHEYATATVASFSTSTATTLDLFSIHEFRACEALVEVHNVTDKKYEVAKVVMTHPWTKFTFTGTTQYPSNATVVTTIAADEVVYLEAGMALSGTGIPAGTTINSVDVGGGTMTMSASATAANTVSIVAQHAPTNDTEVPLTVYSVTQSDSTTNNAGTAQANYSATVSSNSVRLNLKATSDSTTDKMDIKATWKAVTV